MGRNLMRVALCAGFAMFGMAQQSTEQGTLSGSLSGINGQTNVVLILTNVNTGVSQRVTPDSSGSFTVSVPPATYRIEVDRDGFHQQAPQNVTITAGTRSQITITIQGGPVIEAVEVKADASLVEDTPPEIGRSYTTSTIRTLPAFDRNYQETTGLMTGVTPPATSYPLTFDPQRTRQYNTNGLPVFTNDTLSDGISLREPYTGQLAIRILPDEAIQQLNVVTSNYPARQGYAAGALTDVFPRPGTNGLHGSLFGFVTDNFFMTRNSFTPAGVSNPSLHDRQFGGTIGGALMPNRLFFFGSYQGTIYNGSSLQFATVPTTAELGGNFSGLGFPIYNPLTGTASGTARLPFSNGIIPFTSINPIAAAYLRYLPGANVAGATANNLAGNIPFGDRAQVLDGHVDYHFTNDWTGFFRYGWSSLNSHQDSLFGPVIGDGTASTLRNHEAMANVVGNYHGLIAELRVGYSRYRNLLTPTGSTGVLANTLASEGFVSPVAGLIPSISIEGMGSLGTSPNVPQKDIDNDYEGEAIFHIYRGKNQLVFGANVRDIWSSGFLNLQYGPGGAFTFGPGAVSLPGAAITPETAFGSSFASFLTGAPATSGIFQYLTPPSYRQRQYAAFAGDTVRMHRLTLDLGVRYEVYSPVSTRGATGSSIFNLANGTVSFNETVGDYHLGAVQPRVGLAFRLSDKTVIRTSYSINDFPLPLSLLPINVTGTGTTRGTVGSFVAGRLAIPSIPPGGVTAGATAQNIPYTVNALTRNPYVQSYFFMVQQSAPYGFLIDAGYFGNVTRDMPFIQQLNVAAPGAGIAGLPFLGFGQTASVALEGNGLTSNYNSLQVNLTKRLSKGAEFTAAYTFSKAMDHGLTLLNPFGFAGNYAPADWDRTHMLTISHVFDLPFGQGTNRWNQGIASKILGNWKLVGLFHWATGAPYNIYADPLACACPGLPQVLGSPTSALNVNGNASFNPALFTGPLPGTLGGLGRNSVRGPNLTNYNLSLLKTIPVGENKSIELRAESYNLLNSTQYGIPYSNVSYGSFGQPNNNSLLSGFLGTGGRTFVLGARILF